MKKGFTMIELIFVIVILGILASVAIPRLAATREDAEISTAVANLRTLVSDINSYYVVKGTLNGVKWKDITNIPLGSADSTANEAAAFIKVANQNCISIQMTEKNGTPYIRFTKDSANPDNTVCTQVQNAEPIKAYLSSRVEGVTTSANQGAIAIGSTTRVYSK
ncbi:MAG: prepilin-type N-terminal cleavage/methylation domain-containing protein [Campylobacter sp.]|uniref:type II secretion system protein n=1 Tax=Campylobacter sp. TaxID=205 RepID=UPI002A4E932D|nr:prepilin-type N-terminal cleavage/methylation domain-containing protein [Campylobacter sp.]MDD7090453.1 prepilin-type N-terminal cleavage/methylation domain-containing protein [Campylobacteraceae bacterium]MCI6177586.1 prepilin-type N-terminal cleavage/methylation domain-containing protein [Campylobacter sp.]MDY4012759.1 prepilin-type N-terminal cleavage/methylation domain-containing protein [Campylobacter sp.]MDY5284730.1 prepilin-type N-terminal cleavage/methylation domain-containing prote